MGHRVYNDEGNVFAQDGKLYAMPKRRRVVPKPLYRRPTLTLVNRRVVELQRELVDLLRVSTSLPRSRAAFDYRREIASALTLVGEVRARIMRAASDAETINNESKD